jgi:uncharacterized protein (DUF885 family)
VIAMTPMAAARQSAKPNASSAQLQRLIDADWRDQLRADPVLASRQGERWALDKLPSALPDDLKEYVAADAKRLKILTRLMRSPLPHRDRINAELFAEMLRDRVRLAEFSPWRVPMTSDSGFHTEILRIHDGQPFRTAQDYEAYLRRLGKVPAYIEQNITNMREGMRDGFTLPAAVIEGALKTLSAQQFANPEDCPLYEPFKQIPASIAPKAAANIKREGRFAIERHVAPALAQLHSFMEKDYTPRARRTIGASELHNGRNYYQALIRSFTTLDLTADEIHKTGLAEVARIHGEMIDVMRQTGFVGEFSEFLKFLRSDSQFYPKTADELLMRASLIAKRIDGKLPEYFGHLPRNSYGVEPVPADLAPNYTAGRYNGPPLGSHRAGIYWVNTTALDKRPFYTLTALTLHEAVPGHHLQIALAQEQDAVPEFRKQIYYVAFGEGWALYAEKLGREMGIYQTPYDHFGRLTYEMWRACRLVVDTGIHAMGWTRDQAREYLASNTALSLHEVNTEIDRYISWPGQALGYKLGEIKIVELRNKAEAALGAKFDLRRFHDAVLANGSVTLPVLETAIERFIAEERRHSAR